MYKKLGEKMLTKKEFQILEYLRENARYTTTEISRKVGLPRTTVWDKIKKFQKDGLIQRYTCVIDFSQLGNSITAQVLFKAGAETKQDLGNALMNSGHTNSVIKLGNDFDYLASFVFDNMNELHNYLDILSSKYGIMDKKILYVAQDLKREGFMKAGATMAPSSICK